MTVAPPPVMVSVETGKATTNDVKKRGDGRKGGGQREGGRGGTKKIVNRVPLTRDYLRRKSIPPRLGEKPLLV